MFSVETTTTRPSQWSMIHKNWFHQKPRLLAWPRKREEKSPPQNWKHADFHLHATRRLQTSHSLASFNLLDPQSKALLNSMGTLTSHELPLETTFLRQRLRRNIRVARTLALPGLDLRWDFQQHHGPCGIRSMGAKDMKWSVHLLFPLYRQTTSVECFFPAPGILATPRELGGPCLSLCQRANSLRPPPCPISPCTRASTLTSHEAAQAAAAAWATGAPARVATFPAHPRRSL